LATVERYFCHSFFCHPVLCFGVGIAEGRAEGVVGDAGTKVFLVIALTAFISCVLSLQAALSRLIFSFARDNMLPASRSLSKMSGDGMPRNAMLVACAAPMAVCVWVYFQADSLPRVTAFAVLGIYLCFQMVVFAALRQRLHGWKPAGKFSLGSAGPVINGIALAYGVVSMVILARPGDASLPFLDRRRAAAEGLGNVRVSTHDAVEVLRDQFPEASLDAVHLFFPDPWPKKRHHKRRIVQPEFVALVASRLKDGGRFHAATDWVPYAEWMLETGRANPDFPGVDAYSPRPDTRPSTRFEQRGVRLGHEVRDLVCIRRARGA
jgi:amino acid transporter